MWPFDQMRRRKPAGKQATVDTLFGGLWRPRGDNSLSGSEAIFGAVTMLSNTVASLHLRLMHGYEEAVDHPLHRLVSYMPSPRMDVYTFWQTMEACRDTNGNCYALKVPDPDGGVEALDVLDPECVTTQRDRDTGEIWYIVRPKDGGEWYVSARSMIHCKHVGIGGDKGVSPIDVLRDTLDYDAQMKTFSLEQVKGINGAVVLEFPSTFGEAQTKAIIDKFKAHYRRSNGSMLVLSGGVKATSINKSPVDAKVMDVDRITANKVARVYNLPPSLLGDYSKGSYASQEQQQMEYLERTIIPIVRMYESQLNLKLLTFREIREGYRFAFDLSDLVVADQRTRAEVAQMTVRNGLKPINEYRKANGEAPLPGGDVLLVSRDLVPLDYLVRNPAGMAATTK